MDNTFMLFQWNLKILLFFFFFENVHNSCSWKFVIVIKKAIFWVDWSTQKHVFSKRLSEENRVLYMQNANGKDKPCLNSFAIDVLWSNNNIVIVLSSFCIHGKLQGLRRILKLLVHTCNKTCSPNFNKY